MSIPCIASIATAGNRFEEPGKERIGREVAKSSPKWELRLLFLALDAPNVCHSGLFISFLQWGSRKISGPIVS
jgi:hypothetical protein